MGLRYRFVDNSAGVVTTNQVQHREGLRARLKFDPPGRYALNVGLNAALPQRTVSNLVFQYNALPDLRRTGLF